MAQIKIKQVRSSIKRLQSQKEPWKPLALEELEKK